MYKLEWQIYGINKIELYILQYHKLLNLLYDYVNIFALIAKRNESNPLLNTLKPKCICPALCIFIGLLSKTDQWGLKSRSACKEQLSAPQPPTCTFLVNCLRGFNADMNLLSNSAKFSQNFNSFKLIWIWTRTTWS